MINFDGFFHYCAGGPNIFILLWYSLKREKIGRASCWERVSNLV